MSKRPTLQQMALADRRDEAAIRTLLSSKPLNPTYLWHAPGVPTFANAHLLAKEHRITKVSSEVSQTKDGDHIAIVRLRLPATKSVRAGAGRHIDPLVARGFAFRNAVRQLLLEVSP
mgnify:CR=1 FL=1